MRNLKALSLALVAVLAMSAMAATAAQAEDEGHVVAAKDTGEHEFAFVTATDVGETNGLVFTAGESEIVCDRNDFHGEIESGTTKTLTLATAFGGPQATQNCTAAGAPATVDNNGCHVTFKTATTTPGGTTSEQGEWKVTTDLHCPPNENGVEVTAFGGSSHGFLVCTITVPPQTDLEGVTIHNLANTAKEPPAPHDLTATVAVKGIHETQSGLCGSSETDQAEMNGEVTVTARNLNDEPIDLFVEHTKEVG